MCHTKCSSQQGAPGKKDHTVPLPKELWCPKTCLLVKLISVASLAVKLVSVHQKSLGKWSMVDRL